MTGFTAPTPGDILSLVFMERLGITTRELSIKTGIHCQTLKGIISNKYVISDITGLKLDSYFGLYSGFFSSYQAHYRELVKLYNESEEAGKRLQVKREGETKKVKRKVYTMVKTSTRQVEVENLLDFMENLIEELKLTLSVHALLLEMLTNNELYIYGNGKLVHASASAEQIYTTEEDE